MVVRGELVEGDWVDFGGRAAGIEFRAPDPAIHIDRLPLPTPMDMADLYSLTFEDIVEYLDRLGKALDPDANKHVQVAHDAALATSGLTPSILRQNYRSLPIWFDPVFVREMVDATIGIDHLEGWVEQKLVDGRRQRIRAFGSRAVHIVAGNSPVLSGVSVIRNAVTRSDAIIKTPSNDPLTAVAIARTMCEMDPDHPLTKHLAVAYWKGGDVEVESRLYRPEHVEKIVAWGGFASVTHVTRYLQPGLEMIALDPKRSASIIGPEAFESEASMADVARKLACDVGTQNQEGCACARVVYVLSGTDPEGLARLDRLGELTYQAILDLPEEFSTKPLHFDDELRGYLDAQRVDDDWYRVIGGEDAEGAVVVSHLDEPVDYSPILSGRVCNLVPVDSIDRVTAAVNAYTQTVGIYPEALKEELRDRLPLFGAQRMVSLGYACSVTLAGPQDAIEPLRRMCKWIVDEVCDPTEVFPMWERA
jgi:Acyl-CoA reductase (LuxC)